MNQHQEEESRKEEERRKNIGNESQMFPFLFVANPHVLLTIPREAHGCDIICPSPSGQNATVRELEYHITGVVKPLIIHFNMSFHYKPPILGNLHIYIGKLQRFTDLNLAAIKVDDFPP